MSNGTVYRIAVNKRYLEVCKKLQNLGYSYRYNVNMDVNGPATVEVDIVSGIWNYLPNCDDFDIYEDHFLSNWVVNMSRDDLKKLGYDVSLTTYQNGYFLISGTEVRDFKEIVSNPGDCVVVGNVLPVKVADVIFMVIPSGDGKGIQQFLIDEGYKWAGSGSAVQKALGPVTVDISLKKMYYTNKKGTQIPESVFWKVVYIVS